jgi:hypothetical protein
MLSGQLRSAVIIWLVTVLSFTTPQAQVEGNAPTGVITDRLSSKELERWRRIERLIYTTDAEGQILHPILFALWTWLKSSGHTIHLEIQIAKTSLTGAAGVFRLERFDPSGRRHIASIKLYLNNIDYAFVGSETRRPDGVIPFDGLYKEERYAEVLGHELAHAIDILPNLERARQVEELVEQTNELLRSRYQRKGGKLIFEEGMEQRIANRDSFLQQLETTSEMVEALVWRELRTGQSKRAR